MLRTLARKNITLTAIILFILLFMAIQWFKPAFLYNEDGSIKEFGVGYKNKTIMPVWLLSLLLGILCYVAVLYYNTLTRL